ncbi:hypothetical protein [Parabacteroides sp. PF5-9]|uniref:hypothetical protein n=1 Tax=Parabacteroides sp. PF5-9 TaxID=1742404 RepID=UPI002474E849|nr:hypothetical protein [Parabacteroides sp. PF5-9]MDH6357615.1 hypothetical protein [Parabacteroides sp. PF5-9]
MTVKRKAAPSGNGNPYSIGVRSKDIKPRRIKQNILHTIDVWNGEIKTGKYDDLFIWPKRGLFALMMYGKNKRLYLAGPPNKWHCDAFIIAVNAGVKCINLVDSDDARQLDIPESLGVEVCRV